MGFETKVKNQGDYPRKKKVTFKTFKNCFCSDWPLLAKINLFGVDSKR
jgi:hypothetical protein